jgi:hypothetical protein
LERSFNEMGNDLGVGVGGETVALVLEFGLQFKIVFENAVVDDRDAPRAVTVGMGIVVSRTPVRRPSCMAQTDSAAQWLCL